MGEPLSFLIKSAFDASGVTAATNSIKSIDGQINRVSRGFNQLMGLMGAGGIGAAIFAFGKSSVTAFAESEKGIAKLTQAMRNLGSYSYGALQDQLDYAAALQKVTKYTDEQVVEVQTALTTYGLYGETLKAATLATLNLATQTGDSTSAANLVGKAYQGNTTQLAKLGIKISDTAVGAQKFDAVMEQLNKRFGGMAEAEGKSFSGRLEILKNQFDDLKESMGSKLMPVANYALKWFNDLDTVLGYIIEKLPKLSDDRLVVATARFKEITEIFKKESAGPGYMQHPGPFSSALDPKKLKAEQAALLAEINAIKAERAAPSKMQAGGPAPRAPEAELDNQTASWLLNERNGLMMAYYKRHVTAQKKFNRDSNLTEAERAKENKKILRDIEAEYLRGQKTVFGGLEQALDEASLSMGNWKDSWGQVMSGGIGPTQAALKDFFNMSAAGFLNIGTLAEKMFKGIRDAFYDMITQMIAKFLMFKILTGMGLGGTAFGKFIGLATGGPIPGPKGAPMPVMAHGGEFMLSANVVDAIKAGRPTSGLSGGATPAAGGGSATIYQTFQVSGGGNIKDTLREIASAARRGTTEALDAAKVLYKQGAKRSGETAL